VPGQRLGAEVRAVAPSPNLLFKASISSFGNTGLYALLAPNDTGAQRVFVGSNMLTGDLNDDGWKDIVLRRAGTSTTVDTVLVYWGTPTGIDTLAPLLILGENPGDFFTPACIGDVNNDGKPDLMVSAGAYPFPFQRGRVYIYLNPVGTNPPAGTITGDTTFAGLGVACSVGDLNNDGFHDLIIRGWYQLGPTQQRYDYINIYWGIGSDTLNLTLGIHLRGYNLNSRGLACFDANGDGKDDLLWTNRDSLDWIYIHYGGPGFSVVPNLRLRDPGVANFGNAIVNAGDMSGDGNTEIAVAASLATTTSGFVFIFEGGVRLNDQFDAAVGLDSDSDFGRSVSALGDVTGDGLADLIIGAPRYEFGNGRGYWGIFKGDSTITSVHESVNLPAVIRLEQAYPNPFNPSATIEYDLRQRAFVTLKVYNVLGQEVRTLVEKEQEARHYTIRFDATGLSSGAYFYEIIVRTPDGIITRQTKKMLLLSDREKQQLDEYKQHLLTQGLAGDDAALKELARLQYEHTDGRLKQFLMKPEDMECNMVEGIRQ